MPATPDPRSRLWARLPHIELADVLGVIASCVVVLIAFSPILFGGRMLSGSGKGAAGTNGTAAFPGQPTPDYSADFRPDQGASTWAFEPWVEVNHRTYSEGELPLWNPYQGSGTPQAANMQSAPFDPLLLMVNLHPTPGTWDISIIGAFLLGAIATYVFARVLGMWALPAVIASAGFSTSGYFFLYSNNQFSRSYIYLPILFLLVELVLRYRSLWPVFGLGVAIAGNIYVGMPEASFFVIGSAALYALVRLVQQRATVTWRHSVVRLGGGGLLGVLLASPLLLLFGQYEALSFNTHKSGAGTGSQADPLWGLLNWIVPFFHGSRETFSAPGVRSWLGVAIVVTALIALSGRHETKRLHSWTFVALAVLLLAKFYDFGILGWVGKLPVLDQVNFPAFAAPVISFAFAILAGIGIQVLWQRDLDIRRFAMVLGGALALFVLLVVTGDRWHFIKLPDGLSFQAEVWGRAAGFGLAVIVAAFLVWKLHSRWWALIAVIAIVAELFTLAPFSIYAKRADYFATPGWMKFVTTSQLADPHGRVFGIDAKLFPNSASAFGLQDIRALDALYVDRYWRYIRTFVQPTAETRFNGGPYASEETRIASYENNPMFDALAVGTIISEQDLAEVPALKFLGAEYETRVYEKTNAYPRAWVVHDVHTVKDEDDAFGYLKSHAHRENGTYIVDTFDPRTEAVVEAGDGSADQALADLRDSAEGCSDAADDDVTVDSYTADRVKLNVDAACPGLLVLPDTYFPGWVVSVNGKDQEVYATNGALRGVTVPKGTSVVEFSYRPQPFRTGVFLAFAGLLGFAVVAVAVGVRRRRRESEPRSGPETLYSGQ